MKLNSWCPPLFHACLQQESPQQQRQLRLFFEGWPHTLCHQPYVGATGNRFRKTISSNVTFSLPVDQSLPSHKNDNWMHWTCRACTLPDCADAYEKAPESVLGHICLRFWLNVHMFCSEFDVSSKCTMSVVPSVRCLLRWVVGCCWLRAFLKWYMLVWWTEPTGEVAQKKYHTFFVEVWF